MRPPGTARLAIALAFAGVAIVAAPPAGAQEVIKPRVMVMIDTSGSMLWTFNVNNVSCGGDGDGDSSYRDLKVGPNNWYPGINGSESRLYAAKRALSDVINATGDIDFGLMRYAVNEDPRTCPDARNCCTFANPGCFNTQIQVSTVYVDGPINWDGGCGPQANGVRTDGGQVLTIPATAKGAFNPGGNKDPLQWVDGLEDFRDRGDGWPRDGELRAQGPTPLAGSARTTLAHWYGPIYDVSKPGSPKFDAQSPLFDPKFDCRPYVWVAMTDGADTCDADTINGPKNAVADLFAKNPANPLKTYVVGLAITVQGDVNVLNSMAKAGGTLAARFANSQVDIEAALADISASSIKVELCNGKDDNCNDLVDEGFDKAAKCSVGVGACLRSGIKKCDPNNATQTTCCVDDGQPDGPCQKLLPGAPVGEVCNGVDDNCNGIIDDPPVCDLQKCFPETCNGLDDDCDGVVDNHLVDVGRGCGLNVGVCRPGTTACLNKDGGDVGAGAMPDGADALVCSGGVQARPEACNGLDDDCDGVVDGISRACYDGPPPTDNVAGCHDGLQKCTAVPNSGAATWGPCLGQALPQPEVCNGLDDDCDQVVDDVPGANAACCPSGKCGTGACVAGLGQCAGTTLVCVGGRGPTLEACNGLDDDCNGLVDDLPTIGRPCQPQLGGCVGKLACDQNLGQVVCAPGEPSPEVCNGLDDNCNGLVDEEPDVTSNDARVGKPCGPGASKPLPCQAGTTVCDGGNVACRGGTGPAAEVCNCVDDDCSGQVDDGAMCPGGTTCRNCGCYAPCQMGEFPCPGGYDCVDGFCLPHSECDPACRDGYVCIGKLCIDRCAGVNCAVGYRCDHGACVDDSCTTTNKCAACDGTAGQRCDAAKRACVPDLCCGNSCDRGNQFCEPTDGSCQDTCIGKRCGGGQVCVGGQCLADLCAGVACGELEICDRKTGQCRQNLCGSATCVPGFTCCGGTCQQDLCAIITCPEGYRCSTDPIDCTHSCDSAITPTTAQDRLSSSGGGGLFLGCAVARGHHGGGGPTHPPTRPIDGAALLALVGLGLSLRRRRGR